MTANERRPTQGDAGGQAMKLARTKVAAATTVLLKKQGYKCPLCTGSLRATAIKSPVLDHDHQHGHIRDVLCNNCNGIEGRVRSLANRAKNGRTAKEWVSSLVDYWTRHETSQHGLVHHTFKTPEDKRLAANKKARERRAKMKATV